MRRLDDITGMVFGRLEAISLAERQKRRIMWLCKCRCGNYKTVQINDLLSGAIRSCGCLNVAGNIIKAMLQRVSKCKSSSSRSILGYSKEQFMNSIEEQFVDGMSWGNHGKWHVDHIKPVSAFSKEGIVDPKIINSLDNLRPIWAKENLKKHAKY